jgi:hypothetical protein
MMVYEVSARVMMSFEESGVNTQDEEPVVIGVDDLFGMAERIREGSSFTLFGFTSPPGYMGQSVTFLYDGEI